jgi:hypothetical protein
MRFASDISIFWLIPWAVISVFLAIWFYSNSNWMKELSKKWQILFKSLRTGILFIIGILLIGLIFEVVDFRIEKPIIITLVDKSSSLKNYKDSSQVAPMIDALQKSLSEDLGDSYEMIEMTVGSAVQYGKKDLFTDALSNLSAGFEKINVDYYNRNVGGIIFVSDGNFNTGNNPVYAAEKINLTPVFTLGVGDTVQKRDHYIKNVAANEVTFFKNKFPVEVDVEAIKMGKGSSTVSISSNGNTIASQKISYKDGKRDFEHVTFLLDADKIGFQTYTVSVTEEANEFNYKNNKRIFYIEVIDSRSKVLILAGAPHPDLSALKQVIEEDENLEVKAVLMKDWDRDLKKVDLVIWHEPGIGFDASINSLLTAQNISMLYCIGPNTPSSIVQKLNIGVAVGAGNQTDEIQGVVNDGFQQFEISDGLKKSFEYFPPLKTKFGEMKISGGAEIAIFQRLGGIKKKDPLLFFNKRGNSKYGILYGEGIWKWKVNDFVRTGTFDSFTELIQKTTQYLLVKQNKSALHVAFPKRFTKDEDVILNATFYNDAMEAITKPKINLTLTDDKNQKSNFQFGVAGDFYKLSLGKMNPGKYNWTASATYNGKTTRKSGVFVVEDIAIESLDTYANHSLLNQISSKTNGSFDLLKNYKKTIELIKKRTDITSVSYKDASFNDLIDYKILFFLLLLLIATEWFLRRWFGSY